MPKPIRTCQSRCSHSILLCIVQMFRSNVLLFSGCACSWNLHAVCAHVVIFPNSFVSLAPHAVAIGIKLVVVNMKCYFSFTFMCASVMWLRQKETSMTINEYEWKGWQNYAMCAVFHLSCIHSTQFRSGEKNIYNFSLLCVLSAGAHTSRSCCRRCRRHHQQYIIFFFYICFNCDFIANTKQDRLNQLASSASSFSCWFFCFCFLFCWSFQCNIFFVLFFILFFILLILTTQQTEYHGRFFTSHKLTESLLVFFVCWREYANASNHACTLDAITFIKRKEKKKTFSLRFVQSKMRKINATKLPMTNYKCV